MDAHVKSSSRRAGASGLAVTATVLAAAVWIAVGTGGAAETGTPAGTSPEAGPTPAPRPKVVPHHARPAPPPPPATRDGDGDGHVNVALGGDDCDDADANRYPGNPEVCDRADHDEDCDPTTYGHRDADRDGYPDARCCNREGSHGQYCGTDCDDGNAAIHPDAQTCAPSPGFVLVCRPAAAGSRPGAGRGETRYFSSPEGPPWERVACAAGGRCLAQPNGTGVCGP